MRVIEHSDKYKYTVLMSEDNKWKYFRSYGANYDFNLETGYMASWGRNKTEDPHDFPVPNILDCEVTTICKGGCKFCYKSNTTDGVNMTLDEFKHIIDIYPKSLTQVAIGADYDGSSNPDLLAMMDYARDNFIIPNITVGYVSDEMAVELKKRCGAVAVSNYGKDKCYGSVKRLTDLGMTQVNIHQLVSEETFDQAYGLIEDAKTDPRLSKLNAIVFLALKQKGRGESFHTLPQDKFDILVKKAMKNGIGIGFDSCSSLKVLTALGDGYVDSVIPCESSLESSYVNTESKYYPCSFCEGENENGQDWTDGISLKDCMDTDDFIEKVWNNKKTLSFKEALKNTCSGNCKGCRTCPMFEV